MKSIYISGPISGDVSKNKARFDIAAAHLTSQGFAALNPASLPIGLSELQYMQICQPMLMVSDCIYMLEGWENSKGALAEKALAYKLGLTIVFE